MDDQSKIKSGVANDSPTPVYILPHPGETDEINLNRLWEIIAARKSLVVLCLCVSIASAVAYIILTKPLYRVDARLLPPNQQDIQGLLINYSGDGNQALMRYSSDQVFNEYMRNFQSKMLRREFYNSLKPKSSTTEWPDKEIKVVDDFGREFDRQLSLQTGKQNDGSVIVNFRHYDSATSAEWLNQFIAYINKHTINQYLRVIRSGLKAEIKLIEYQLASKLKFAEQRRRDNIVLLKEASALARALGVDRSMSIPINTSKTTTDVEVNVADMPLYMRGTKALEAEIAILESRKTDEPFISGYRDLQERRAFLENISIDVDTLSSVSVDAEAKIPQAQESPRKLLVILLAVIAGVLTSMLLILVLEIGSKARYKS